MQVEESFTFPSIKLPSLLEEQTPKFFSRKAMKCVEPKC